MRRRTVLRAGGVTLAGGLVGVGALAQAWPTKPIRFIVPYIPGSAPDVLARVMSERLGGAIGQPLVIENRPGAGGNVGTEQIVKAAPDGYAMGLATSATTTNPWLYRKVNYDPVADFAAINLCIAMPHCLVVSPDAPYRNTAELIKALKDEPGKFSYASGGNGSGAHLSGELFKASAGVDAVHIPYKGAPEIISAVIGKSVQFGFPTLGTAFPQIKAGRLRAIAVTGNRRNHALSDVPTVAETVAGYEVIPWFGLVAPARTPIEMIRRLDTEAQKALNESAFRDRIQADGSEVVNMGHQEFAAYIKTDLQRWKRVVEISGARVD